MNVQEPDEDVQGTGGADDREVDERPSKGQVAFVLQALGLTLFFVSPLTPGYWFVLSTSNRRLGQSIFVLGCLAVFLGLLAFRWRWARPVAALCAAAAIAGFFA